MSNMEKRCVKGCVGYTEGMEGAVVLTPVRHKA